MTLFPLLALVASASIPAEITPQPPPAVFEPVIGGSAFGEAGAAAGNVFTLLPLNGLTGLDAATDKVLFLEPFIGWQEGGVYSASLGLGFRQLFDDPTQGKTRLARDIDLLGEGWYLGGNLFVDGVHAAHDTEHWQLSTGIEIGSRYLTLRGNYYWPLTDARRWGQFTTTRVIGRTQGKDYELSVGPVVTSGPAIGTRDIHVTTTPVESIRQKLVTYGLYDEALRGWDTELSVLVPVIDKYVDFRLVAGLYGFDGGGSGHGFQGWQVGAELRPVPAVVLMATHVNDGRFSEGQWMAGVRFEVPLGSRSNEAFRLRKRELRERLMEPVQRRYGPTVVSKTQQERARIVITAPQPAGPATIEGLQLSAVPKPGDVIQLQNGTLLVVEADGKSLRALRQSDYPIINIVAFVPEPSRALLVLLGLAAILGRRRRVLS